MREKYFYDNAKYLCYLGGTKSKTRYIVPSSSDIVTLIDRQDSSIYSVGNNTWNIPKNVEKLRLAGGITYLSPKTYSLCYPKRVLRNELLGTNLVKIVYDGITHLSIEDDTYIYYLDIVGYVDIDIKSMDKRLYLSYIIDDIRHLIVILRENDYIEELNLIGDSIIIEDNSIELMRKYNDSLGRVRHIKYNIIDNRYKEINSHFDYTYTQYYDRRLFMRELEEAVYAEDYEYISRYMREADRADIASYFQKVLGNDYSLFYIEPLSLDTIQFIENNGIKKDTMRIRVEMDGDRIVNFDTIE